MQLFDLSLWILVSLIGIVNAAGLESKKNIEETTEYYRKLIAGDTSQVSELNMFVTAMPKGGDLHHHYSGSIYVETYLDWVDKYNYCIYREDNSTLKIEKYRIENNPAGLSNEAKALCISAQQTRQDNSFYRQLSNRWSNIDYTNHYHEQRPPDQHFFDTFGYFGPVSSSDYHEGLLWLKNTAINENVQYIETMLASGPNLVVAADLNAGVNALRSDSSDQDIEQALTTYVDAIADNTTINDYVELLTRVAEGINDNKFTLRFQSYVARSNPPARVFASLYSAFSAATRSELIVGVNIVGAENGIVAMRDYTLHMKMFRFLKRRFPSVQLAMHAGELVLGLVPPEGLQFHIREAIEIAGATRIGHGIDIFYERNSYELLQKMKERRIVVEVVISSNSFILGIKNEAHPMLVYKAHGVPLVIATDDAGVSRSTMSNEYLMFADRYKPTYGELKALVYNSIQYSFLSESDKQREKERLDTRFLEFEAMIANVARTLGDPNGPSSSASLQKIPSLFILFFILTNFFRTELK